MATMNKRRVQVNFSASRLTMLLLVVATLALLLVGCNNGATNPESPSEAEARDKVEDFKIGLYQGQEQLGSAEIFLSDLQGKPVVLNYWAGLCPPCRAEMPEFQEFSDEYEGKVTLIGVDLGQYLGLGSRENAQELLAELEVTYPAGFTDDGAVVEAHRVFGLPTTIFVTAEGDLHKKWDGVLNKDKLGEIAEEMLVDAGG